MKPVGQAAKLGVSGAGMIAAHDDGSAQIGEITGGSGDYGQSIGAYFFGYSDFNPAVRMEVRWPPRVVSEQSLSANLPFLILSVSPR